MVRHAVAILSAVHGAGRAHGALHPTAVEVEYEGSEHVRRKFSGYNFELKSEAREIT